MCVCVRVACYVCACNAYVCLSACLCVCDVLLQCLTSPLSSSVCVPFQVEPLSQAVLERRPCRNAVLSLQRVIQAQGKHLMINTIYILSHYHCLTVFITLPSANLSFTLEYLPSISVSLSFLHHLSLSLAVFLFSLLFLSPSSFLSVFLYFSYSARPSLSLFFFKPSLYTSLVPSTLSHISSISATPASVILFILSLYL